MSTSSRFGMSSKKHLKITAKYRLNCQILSILKAQKSHVEKSPTIATGALQGGIAWRNAHTWVAQCSPSEMSLQITQHLINVAVQSNLAKSDLAKTTRCRLADFRTLSFLANLK